MSIFLHVRTSPIKLLTCFLLFFSPCLVSAQQKGGNIIQLKSTRLDLAVNAQQWLEQTAVQRNAGEPRQTIVQLAQIPSPQQRDELKAKGILLQDYIDNKAYTALIYPRAMAALVPAYQLRAITDVKYEWKAETALWRRLNAAPQQMTRVAVLFFKEVQNDAIRKWISNTGGTVVKDDMEKLHLYTIDIQSARVKELAQWYGVRSISPGAKYEPLDVEQNAAAGGAIIQAPIANGGYGLKGDGITIGVGDNISGIYHIDLVDRIINYHPGRYTNHGQHMNGIVGSAGIIDPKSEGVVPHATLVDHIFANVLANTAAMRSAHNMNITNNSYAAVVGDTAFAGTYDGYSQAVDELALQYLDVLHVFASGNDGYMARPPYPMTYGTVCGGYQPAKNNIVVTNSSKKLVNRWEASKGPVLDGRLKPELSAIGNEILSTRGTDIYLVSGGTSMACPQVSGLAGILTQRYKQIFGNTNPRSDVLKTLLLNGAYDDGNPGPDFAFGFGMVDIHRSIIMLDSGRYSTNTMNNGGQTDLQITVPANIAQLKVMLSYHDKPAAIAAPRDLVNDLDLEVIEPSTTVHYPLILNTDVPNVLDFAAEGRDSLNNSEQVTINNPAAGTYTIRVKGYNIPQGPQPYVIAYDWIGKGIKFKNPIKGTVQSTNDSLNVYWDASAGANPFTLEYSTNNGGSWTTIDNNIPSNQKYYTWFVPNVSSEECLLRLSRNSTAETATSELFVINPKPVVYVDSGALCPGYIKINWGPVQNATNYIVMRKKGFYMEPIATTNDTTYTFSGLTPDSLYYMAVQPMINGMPGYRSIAVTHKPNTGTCAGNISNGDLMMEAILQPTSGRSLTSTQLSNNETMVVRVRNLDDVASGGYTVHYAVNGTWQTQTGTGIPANGSVDVSITGINLAAAGNYVLQAAIENTSATDNVTVNDSARKVVRNLVNNPVSLVTTYAEGFESFNVSTKNDSMGISADQRWDYENNLPDSGRIRSYINDSFLIAGTRSITMDMGINRYDGAQNYLTGTFNFSSLDTASDEVRADFDYMIHGRPKFYDGNEVWVRGKDTDPWLPLYHYDTSIAPATVVNSGSLSVTQVLRTNNQNFSTSFQIRLGQNDTSLVASKDYGNGTTFDNFRLYTLQKDMQMLAILSPLKTYCNYNGSTPVTVKLYNSVSQVQTNTQVSYRFDGGAVVNETIASIAGYDTLNYTFNQLIASVTPGPHTLDVWLSAPGDGFLSNDSVLNYSLNNQPMIATYPYLQDFEANNGLWYHNGTNDSWEYGTPSSVLINTAGSGTKAWKTNLDGYYRPVELSYLYTTCFDISGLDSPILEFKLNFDVESCCDDAYMEYSYDGQNWTRLGAYGEGTNWYTEPSVQAWRGEDSVVWRDAILPLPQSSQPIRFRYVLKTDMGTEKEGLAIDDFRIYNYEDGDTTNVEPFEGVVLYPNPTNTGKVTVKWSGAPGTRLQVAICDVAGRIVFKDETVAVANVNETVLNTGRYMSGVYFVKLIIGGEIKVIKVVFN